MPLLVAVEGDIIAQGSCHDPTPAGGGDYPVSPVTLQGFVFISGKKVIPKGQDYPAHETGYAGTLGGSSFVFVAGIAVVRDGDLGTHSSCHAVSPIVVSGQDFVFEA